MSKQRPCHFCEKQSKTIYMRTTIHKRYFESFNFYFAKPINEILSNVPIDHVILFKDLLYLHDENEYMKRFYQKEELGSRLLLLANIYESQAPAPNLGKVQVHKILEKRINKLLKLKKKEQVDQKPITRRMIPEGIFNDNYVEASYSESYPQQQISYESQAHNIFDQSAQQQKEVEQIVNQPAPPAQQQAAQGPQSQVVVPKFMLDHSAEGNKLFNCGNDAELDAVFNQVNALTSRQLSSKGVVGSAQKFRKPVQNDSKKTKAPVPPLKLQDSAKSSSNKSSTMQNLMKKYDQILQKRFQVKEILTERNEPKSHKKISDEMLIKIYKQHLEQMKRQKKHNQSNQSENYQYHGQYKIAAAQQNQPPQSCTFEKENERNRKKFTNKVYLPKPIIRKPPSQLSSPSTTNIQNTCSPSMLLRSLSNPSMAPSPARRLEIKVNLNKLIHQQDEEVVGYWTQRCKVR